jgi:hypothetical protein
MTKAEQLFHEIAASLPNATEGKMFGALAIKAPNGKAAVLFKNDEIAFKLDAAHLAEALALPGAQLFDPSGSGRPMGGWAQVPYRHAAKWRVYAPLAMEFVGGK